MLVIDIFLFVIFSALCAMLSFLMIQNAQVYFILYLVYFIESLLFIPAHEQCHQHLQELHFYPISFNICFVFATSNANFVFFKWRFVLKFRIYWSVYRDSFVFLTTAWSFSLCFRAIAIFSLLSRLLLLNMSWMFIFICMGVWVTSNYL